MTSLWIHRLHIIIAAENREQANGLATSIDPDTGGAFTFGEPTLSTTGEQPATHVICNTASTEDMRLAMVTALGMAGFPVAFWRIDASTETLTESNVTEATGQPWTVADSISAAGLQVTAIEDIP